jgi:predicted aspartyl protease
MGILESFAMWLATLASVSGAVAIERAGVTQFDRQQNDIVLSVRLNGLGPFRMLLDTGSTHTAVSAATAEAIGAAVVAKAALGSAAGGRETLVVRIKTLDVGPINVRNIFASVVALENIPDGADLDGVIGQDALESVRYTIDFRQHQVVWWPDDGLLQARGSALELQSSGGRFLLLLPQRRSLVRLVPDTGAASLLLFAPHAALPVTLQQSLATLTTTSGGIAVRMATVRELHVGGLILRDVPAVVASRDRSEPAEVDGLLPLYLFDRVTVDGPGKRLIVEKS